MISTVVFDLGGVAARFLPERRLAALTAASNRSEEDVYALLWESGFDDDCDAGAYSAEEAFDYVRRSIGMPLTFRDFMSIWASAFEPDQDVLELIEAMRPRLRTGLLTYNGAVLLEALPGELPAVASKFDELFFSSQIGHLKPDRRVFEHVTDSLDLAPDEIAFIDDSPQNVHAARQFGWHSHVFQDSSQAGNWLAALADQEHP